MHPTRNDLPVAVRTTMIDELNARLADTIDLFNQLKQAHWNTKGPHFIALHELFDSLAEHAEEWSDELAERAVQLGGQADGTSPTVAKKSALPPYDAALTDGLAHVAAIANALAKYGSLLRTAIAKADELNDKDTADLFTELSRGTDKDLWFVEAHLQQK